MLNCENCVHQNECVTFRTIKSNDGNHVYGCSNILKDNNNNFPKLIFFTEDKN